MDKTSEETMKKDLISDSEFYSFQVCKEWKETAFVTRNNVFKDTEQGNIDLFDIKVFYELMNK